MKKIFLFLIFISIYTYSQENRLVRQNELSDSTASLSNRINLKLTTSDTTNQRTFSDLKYLNKAFFDDTLLAQISRFPTNASVEATDEIVTYDDEEGFLSVTPFSNIPLPDSVVYTSEIVGKANTTLDNLGTTSINTDLRSSSIMNVIGDGIIPFQSIYLWNGLYLQVPNGLYCSYLGHTPATANRNIILPDASGTVSLGTGTTDQIPYWVNANTLGGLSTGSYPTLIELAYVKGVTSAIQTQLTARLNKADFDDSLLTQISRAPNNEEVRSDDNVVTYDNGGNITLTPFSDLPTDSLVDLLDVTITSPQVDQTLKYNGSKWLNATVAAGGSVSNADSLGSIPAGSYMLKSDSTALHFVKLANKLDDSDTTTLIAMQWELDGKLNKADTSVFVSDALADSKYLAKGDTLSLSNRVNLKFNIADTSVFVSDALADAKYLNKTIFDDSLNAQLLRTGLNNEIRTDDAVLTIDNDAALTSTPFLDLPVSQPTSIALGDKLNVADSTGTGYFTQTDALDKLNSTAFDDTLLAQVSRFPTNASVEATDEIVTYDDEEGFLSVTPFSNISLPDSVVFTSEIAGDSIIGTANTLDSLITDYWNGTIGSSTDTTFIYQRLAEKITSTSMNDLTEFDTQINLSGTASSSTYLRGDGTWQTITGSLTALQETQIAMTWAYLQLDTTANIIDAFAPVTGAIINTLYTSESSEVEPNDVVRVAVDSGQYLVKYDIAGTPTWMTDWTGTAGFYKGVDSVKIRHRTGATGSTAYLQNVTIGNSTEQFSVTTVAGEDNTPPAKPTSLVATPSSATNHYLAWTDPADADLDSILVYRGSTNDTSALTFVANVLAGTQTYTWTGGSANTTYWWGLKAVDDSNNVSYWSNTDSSRFTSAVEDTGFAMYDAEDGLANLTITGGNIVDTSGFSYAGSKSYKIRGRGGVLRNDAQTASFAGKSTIWVTFRVYIPAATSMSDPQYNLSLLLGYAGDVLSDPSFTMHGTTSAAIDEWMMPYGNAITTNFSTGAWHKWEIKYTKGTGANSIDSCWIDQTFIYGRTNGDNTQDITRINFGQWNWQMAIGEAYYLDNIILSENRLPLD